MCILQSATIANHAKTLFETGEEVQLVSIAAIDYAEYALETRKRRIQDYCLVIFVNSAIDGAIYYFVVKLTT